MLLVAAAAVLDSKETVEQCLAKDDDSCDRTRSCSGLDVARDCLRADVLFRTPYVRIKCCFRCCVEHWLAVSGLDANVDFHAAHLLDTGFGSARASPDTADYGFDPKSNLIIHPHAFAAVSHTRMHSHHGCLTRAPSGNFTLVSLYQHDPNSVILQGNLAKGPHAECIAAIHQAKTLIVDVWRQNKLVPFQKVFDRVALILANNVGNLTEPHCSEKSGICKKVVERPWEKVLERVIGVRAISVWEATLENPLLASVPRQHRLLLCCCMNVDAKHSTLKGGNRKAKVEILSRVEAFGCPSAKGTHMGPPKDSPVPGAGSIEAAVQAAVALKYTAVAGKFDTHMPILLFSSRFVFSPNGVGEQCYREYEAILAGAYPLVDRSYWSARRRLLAELPVIPVDDWSVVTPEFLEAQWLRLEKQTFNVKKLFLPYYYDRILAAAGI